MLHLFCLAASWPEMHHYCGEINVTHLCLIPWLQPISGCLGHMSGYNISTEQAAARRNKERKPLCSLFTVLSPSLPPPNNWTTFSHFSPLFVTLSRHFACLCRVLRLSEERRSRERGFLLSRLAFLGDSCGCVRWKAAYGKFVFLFSSRTLLIKSKRAVYNCSRLASLSGQHKSLQTQTFLRVPINSLRVQQSVRVPNRLATIMCRCVTSLLCYSDYKKKPRHGYFFFL